MKNLEQLLTLIIANIHSFEETMNFRKGQKPFYDKIIEGLMKGWTTMFIKGPTGMGKTFLEAMLAAAMIGNSDIKILLLTSKITLLKQIQKEFVKFVGFLKTGLFGGGFKNYSEQVTIMTYASYQRQNEEFIKQFKVLLLDEGHRGLGKLTKIQLEKQKEFSILIGFTASDEYSEKKSLTKFLVNKAHELSIVEVVELGMLSNIKVMIASVDIEIENQHKGESKGQYDERMSAEIIREGGNIATARLYKRVFAKRNLRGITLVLTTKQGLDLVNEFRKEGVKAELINSKIKMTERLELFERFRNHEFDVLVGMGIIKEGFNGKGVSVAITTYPVNSRVDMTQFPGRAERIDDDNPDKVAYIVNLAYKNKKQLFYTDILGGKSEVLQKKKRKKKLDIISSREMQSAIARKPDSFITSVAVEHEEVMDIVRGNDLLAYYYSLPREEQLEMLNELRSLCFKRVGALGFGKLDFGIFGKNLAFSGLILSRVIYSFTNFVIEEISKKLNWYDKVKTLENVKIELAKHGIINRVSLLKTGPTVFKKIDFGFFKKGALLAGFILSRSLEGVTVLILEEMAEKLFEKTK